MVKFFEVTLTNKLGKQASHKMIGTLQQVNDWAIGEAASYGCTYDVIYLCTDTLDGIRNLCNKDLT